MKIALLACLAACGGRADPPPAASGSSGSSNAEILERLDRLERKLDALATAKAAAPIDAGATPTDADSAVADATPKPPKPPKPTPAVGQRPNDLEPFPTTKTFPGAGSAKTVDCSKSIVNVSDPKCRAQWCKFHPNDVRCEMME